MSKKILILSAVLIMFAAACKKDSNPASINPTARTLDFKASSSDTMKISLVIIRPTGLTTGVVGQEIGGGGTNGTLSPFEYKSTKIQAGDSVYIQAFTTPEKAITGALLINGISIPYTTAVKNTVFSGYTWNIYVK